MGDETRYNGGRDPEDELPLDTFFLPLLSDSRFFLRHKEGYKSLHHLRLSHSGEPTHGINNNSYLF
jgi:hypothetical protein